MSKEKLMSILDTAFANGTPFIDYTSNYVYCLIPNADDTWTEVSYDMHGAELDERNINSARAFRMLVEELEKGIAMECDDFMLLDFRNFRNTLGDKPDVEKVKAVIKELSENSAKYSENLPVVTSKENLEEVKKQI